MAENKHRWKIQLGATLASNPFLMNFLHGRISRTGLKAVCVPGLNCYSCPAAAASCPIGALQAVIGSSKFQFAWYVVGFLIFAGALLGRGVCGFLCPFGWFQELLHKIPAKKFSTRRVRILTYLKYGILALFVIVLPMTVVNEVGMGDPFFCKYICPAGILEGGIPLALADAGVRAGLGGLFTWKSCILLGTALLAVFFYRPFCKWLCPLGAFTGCATEFPSAACRWTRAGAPPAGRAVMRAEWMWMCSRRPTMLSASAAGTVRLPAPMGPSPGYFQSKQYKRRRRLPHETCSDPIAVGGTDDRRIDRLQLR